MPAATTAAAAAAVPIVMVMAATASAAATTAAGAAAVSPRRGKLAGDKHIGGGIRVAGIAQDRDDAHAQQQALGLISHLADDDGFNAKLLHKLRHLLMAVPVGAFNELFLALVDILAIVIIDGKALAVSEMAADLAVIVSNRYLHN